MSMPRNGDLDSFIEWVEQADPPSAQVVRDGYCSWEDLGYDGDQVSDEWGSDPWSGVDVPLHLSDDYGNYPDAEEEA